MLHRRIFGLHVQSFESTFNNDLYSNYLTPWSRVLSDIPTDLQPVKKFPEFYGTRRFITPFTRAHHLTLSSPDLSDPCRTPLPKDPFQHYFPIYA